MEDDGVDALRPLHSTPFHFNYTKKTLYLARCSVQCEGYTDHCSLHLLHHPPLQSSPLQSTPIHSYGWNTNPNIAPSKLGAVKVTMPQASFSFRWGLCVHCYLGSWSRCDKSSNVYHLHCGLHLMKCSGG